ncbi:MAG: hypothetical protein K6T27_04260 [Thermoleophilum sp.]|nr:hypothetical protein [Thermoleophilum sp.]
MRNVALRDRRTGRLPRSWIAVAPFAAALIAHELRYRLAGPAVAADRPHGYLAPLDLVAVALFATACGAIVAYALRPPHSNRRSQGGARLVAASAFSALLLYLTQETVEALASGSAITSYLFAHGGWVGPVVACALGALAGATGLFYRSAQPPLEPVAAPSLRPLLVGVSAAPGAPPSFRDRLAPQPRGPPPASCQSPAS